MTSENEQLLSENRVFSGTDSEWEIDEHPRGSFVSTTTAAWTLTFGYRYSSAHGCFDRPKLSNATGNETTILNDGNLNRWADLFDALQQMRDMDDDDSMHIDNDTYRSACSVLSLLSYKGVTPPRVFSHGGDAVVFTWQRSDASYQLTVSNGVAALGRRIPGERAFLVGHVTLATHSIESLIPFAEVQVDPARTSSSTAV